MQKQLLLIEGSNCFFAFDLRRRIIIAFSRPDECNFLLLFAHFQNVIYLIHLMIAVIRSKAIISLKLCIQTIMKFMVIRKGSFQVVLCKVLQSRSPIFAEIISVFL